MLESVSEVDEYIDSGIREVQILDLELYRSSS